MKTIIQNHNKFREICLKNAEDLLIGAKALLDNGIDHASFHMSLLTLEEIGKVEIEAIRIMSLIHPRNEPISISFDIEAHERKIFWAFWGVSFGREKQTKELFDKNHYLARNLHNKRLEYLYSNPENPQHWSVLMGEGEAKQLYELAEVRLRMEKSMPELDEASLKEPDEDLIWFFNVQEEKERCKEIWGNKSQNKLLELGDISKWIKWLRALYEKNDEEIREIMKREIQRKQPPEDQKMNNKWRIRMEIITTSHSIRQNKLREFNEISKWIKLNYRDSHTLIVELVLSKNTPIHALWEHGWGTARMFVASLNIATHGFFWWNIKKDAAKYYEEIWDLENNMGVHVQLNPKLEVNWREKRFVLREVDLSITSLTFSYITHCKLNKTTSHLDHYVAGLSLLAKNDIHLRLEMNAFEEFFKALKIAMIENGEWDQCSPFEKAYQRKTGWRFPVVTGEMKVIFPLGFKVELEHNGLVDLTNVYAIKNYCEVYFQSLAAEHLEKETGQVVRFVLGDEQPAIT